ncbi:brevican core protein-like isoform X2 [Neocloeon triangulifer]|uniref:brevican core protein-like isoform X2 n=1 Tax=Neocloeon triangulifer TaxID=2078957 RepID=UPI00286F21B3|nr:brevican core protein-like isoform X2 [Neocloeon triangulifer]
MQNNTAFIVMLVLLVTLLDYGTPLLPKVLGSNKKHTLLFSSEVPHEHQIVKRSPRKTIIYVTRLQKRKYIIKCCGMRRCTSNSSTTQIETKAPPKTTKDSQKGTTLAPGKKVTSTADETSPPADTEGPTENGPFTSETPAEGEIVAPAEVPNTITPGATEIPSNAGLTLGPSETPASTTEAGITIVATETQPPADTTIDPGTPAMTSGVPISTGPIDTTSTLNGATTPATTNAITNASVTTTTSAVTTTLTSTAQVGTNAITPGTTTAVVATTAPTTVVTRTSTTLVPTTPPPPCYNSKSNYTFSMETQTWGKARIECQKQGMDLANLVTVEENICVKHLISANQKTNKIYWIALTKMGQSNYTQWLSGQELVYNDWNPGDPASITTDDCAVIWKDKWFDAPCFHSLNYICETPRPFDMCSSVKPFSISTNKLSFDNARAECQKTKMDLVSLETPDQNICLQRQLASLGKNLIFVVEIFNFQNWTAGMEQEMVHMGLTMEGTKNYTSWVNAKPLTYTDWSPGNPAQFGSDQCASSYLYHWLDIPCTNVYNYACEDTVIM